ncbi:MAG: SAM-dependent methyltransferase [Armatimonadetes bacterium]|nr:SAM-dependent methyltransferase [Armatimonadota bacterium]MDE2206346.1 SAM-dependent methyltransferase [Armatimonadota bacterium]
MLLDTHFEQWLRPRYRRGGAPGLPALRTFAPLGLRQVLRRLTTNLIRMIIEAEALAGELSRLLSLGQFVSGSASVGHGNPLWKLRPITLRGKAVIQIEERDGATAAHRNCSPMDAGPRLAERIVVSNWRTHLKFTDSTISIRRESSGRVRVSRSAATRPAAQSLHNRAQNHILPEGAPCPFLTAVGIMTPDGRVLAAHYHKFRQVNRFLELIRDIAPHLPAEGPISIVDFGAGRAVLTLATYHYVSQHLNRNVRVIGVDVKQDQMERAAVAALAAGFTGATFQTSNIRDFVGPPAADLVLSLHACDTATDEALLKAIQMNARVILAAPCCQHELRSRIQAPQLAPMLRHGLFRERLAALATDGIRTALLEAFGYQVKVVEFVEAEHTSRNILLRAVLTGEVRPHTQDWRSLCDFWGAEPALARWLRAAGGGQDGKTILGGRP